MWLNPEFKAKVMMWLADNLLGLRNGSAYSYKKMTRAIYYKYSFKYTYIDYIIELGREPA